MGAQFQEPTDKPMIFRLVLAPLPKYTTVCMSQRQGSRRKHREMASFIPASDPSQIHQACVQLGA